MRQFSMKCVFIALAGSVFAQTPAPPATLPCDPAAEKVPNGLADITEILNVCPEIGHLAALPASDGITPFSSVIDPTLMADQFKAQAYINLGIAQLSDASARLSRLAIKKANKEYGTQTKLQIATAIIGLLGGGVGGGLHLVNNPQVGHAATLVGIGAGTAGGSLGLYSALKYPPPKDPTKTPSYVALYGQKLGHRNINTIGEDPDELSDVIAKMADQLEKLQTCVVDRSKCKDQ